VLNTEWLFPWQVGLGLYLANMLKALKSASRQMEADLELAGHPNKFPSVPSASKFDWDMLQSIDYRTLLCTHCHVGTRSSWEEGISLIYDDTVESVSTLLSSLAETPRTIHPTTDARVLLMPTQRLLTGLLLEYPDDSNAELVRKVRMFTENFVTHFIDGGLGGAGWVLDDALHLYECFHVLESLDTRWSPNHLFKCNCSEFFKRASCHHCLLAGMACDMRIRVPGKYRAETVQQRRKRGRPSAGACEVGDAGEARARARIALQQQYIPPQVWQFHTFRPMWGETMLTAYAYVAGRVSCRGCSIRR